jgi:hypothetical protein
LPKPWPARRTACQVQALEAENTKLKKLLPNSMLQIDAMRQALKGKEWPWRHVAKSCGSLRVWA